MYQEVPLQFTESGSAAGWGIMATPTGGAGMYQRSLICSQKENDDEEAFMPSDQNGTFLSQKNKSTPISEYPALSEMTHICQDIRTEDAE